LESNENADSPMGCEFSALLKEYERLLKQQRILVKTSDKQQLRLNKLNDQLDVRNNFITRTFGKYLSEEIVNTILESPEGASLGGEKRVVTILMSDLRGFTALTERLPAESVVGIINIYLEIMTDIIFKYKGTIDEFIGDGILAIFGAPDRREDDARRAVACAVEMQLAISEVNRRNRDAGYPGVEMGIGINTGELVVGNIGSPKRIKYGVVGSHVNLTSRIESYTVGGQIYISQSTLENCGDILRIDDRVEVMPKGVKKPVAIYDIGGIYDNYNLFLPNKKEKPLKKLEKPLNLHFAIISGNNIESMRYVGSLVSLGTNEAEISSQRNVRKLTDLKIILFDEVGGEVPGELYAKVVKNISEYPFILRINFTALTSEIKKFLHPHTTG
ncbi:MAG: adenylate/guanylate cyclase domain-containing protein, partial [bacterium]|nr:adenylate/guanylate cyclase domain-containing protein [bacterium]